MELFLQQLVSGISIGAIYSLLAVGYALVYSVYNFTNWAFDAFMAFGAFMAFTAISSFFLPFWAAMIYFNHSYHHPVRRCRKTGLCPPAPS